MRVQNALPGLAGNIFIIVQLARKQKLNKKKKIK